MGIMNGGVDLCSIAYSNSSCAQHSNTSLAQPQNGIGMRGGVGPCYSTGVTGL